MPQNLWSRYVVGTSQGAVNASVLEMVYTHHQQSRHMSCFMGIRAAKETIGGWQFGIVTQRPLVEDR